MDDNLKVSLVVFNLTAGLFMLFRYMTLKHMDYGALFFNLLIGAGVGLVFAAITYSVLRKK